MRRLQSDATLVSLGSDEPDQWILTSELSKKSSDFFVPLIKKHTLLNIEYSVLCTHLTHDFFRSNKNEEEITEHLIVALTMAELLTYIYSHYLKVPREVVRLQNEQKVYRQLLMERGIHFDNLIQNKIKADTITQGVRALTISANWLRLFSIRGKRVLNALVPLVTDLKQFARFMAGLDKVANPFFAYLGWLFFIPRLMTNLFLLAKHVLPGPWMKQKEEKLGWWLRFIAQLQRRWFELANDSVWLLANALNCFVWLGPLAPIGIYINVALYVYDVLLASLRAYLEISRLKKLQNEYEEQAKLLKESGASQAELQENARLQKHLADRVVFEQGRLMISVLSTSALTIAIIICLPTLAFHPFIPLLGACMLLGITLGAYLANRIVESQRPPNQIAKLVESKNSFFSSSQVMFKPPVKEESLQEQAGQNLQCKY